MRESLSGVAGMDEHVVVARITADERGVIDRVQDLSRPTVRDVTQVRQEGPDP